MQELTVCISDCYVLHFCNVFPMRMEIQLLELGGHSQLLCEMDTRFCMYDSCQKTGTGVECSTSLLVLLGFALIFYFI